MSKRILNKTLCSVMIIFLIPAMQYAMQGSETEDQAKKQQEVRVEVQQSEHDTCDKKFMDIWHAFLGLQSKLGPMLKRQNSMQLLLIQLQNELEGLKESCKAQNLNVSNVRKQVARMAIVVGRIRAEQDKEDQGNATVPTSSLALQSQIISPRTRPTSPRDIESPLESDVASPRETKVISPRLAAEK